MADLYYEIVFRSSSSSSVSSAFSSSSSSSSSSVSSSSSSSSCPFGLSEIFDGSYFNNQYWGALAGSWDGSSWQSAFGGPSIDVVALAVSASPNPNWADGYRPTKMRVTWTQSGSGLFGIVLADVNNNVIAGTELPGGFDLYDSGVELDITYQGVDLGLLSVSNNNDSNFNITNIEFFNGLLSCSSSSSSSSSSESASCVQEFVDQTGPNKGVWDWYLWDAGNSRYDPEVNGNWVIVPSPSAGYTGDKSPQRLRLVVQNDIGWNPQINQIRVEDTDSNVMYNSGPGPIALDGDGVPTEFIIPLGQYGFDIDYVLIDGGSNKIYLNYIGSWEDCGSSSSSSESAAGGE